MIGEYTSDDHFLRPSEPVPSAVVPPLKPTWRRYRKIFFGREISIYRALMYEELYRIEWAGRIFDFGGGACSHYFSELTSKIAVGGYESANVDPLMMPTYLTGSSGILPFDDAVFDMVMSLNTLEYVLDVEGVMRELVRVLRPGGRIVLGVPFLFRVHGADDYHRQTANWWTLAMGRLGLDGVTIYPLAWDFLTAGLSVTASGGPLKTLRRLLVPLYGLAYAAMRSPGSGERYSDEVGSAVSNVALGYLITGRKKICEK
jgi:SAM-dependent methyltransferase